MDKRPIPRFLQGFEPGPAYRDAWRSMTPSERRADFLFDMGVVAVVLALVAIFAPQYFSQMLGIVAILLALLFAGNTGRVKNPGED